MTISYAPSPEWKSVGPRQLLPIDVHPNLQNIETPQLPSPPRPRVFHTTLAGIYLRSTHLIPAAFPRLVPDIPLPQTPQYTPGKSPAERLKELESLTQEAMEKQHKLTQGMLGGGHSTKVLWNCVNRYVRTRGNETGRVQAGNTTGMTLFLAHAGGFSKEIWETMLHSLLDSPAGYMVDEVWAWEAVHHGDSGLINSDNLSGVSDWSDDVRDIAHFLLSYLPEDPATEALPARLERLPESTSEARKEHRYRTRKMVVVGHSFGGCTSLRAAVDFPKLFSSIVLVDAAIVQPYTYPPEYYGRVLGAISRCIDHALTDDSNGGIKLKMSGVQEGLCFINYLTSWEMWELLDKVDEAITLRWVVPKEGLMGEEATRVRVWRRPANSSNVIFHSCGHLIVQEAPVELVRPSEVKQEGEATIGYRHEYAALQAENDQDNEPTSSMPLARLRRLVTLTINIFRRAPEDSELSHSGLLCSGYRQLRRAQNAVEFSDDEGNRQSLDQTPKEIHAATGSVQGNAATGSCTDAQQSPSADAQQPSSSSTVPAVARGQRAPSMNQPAPYNNAGAVQQTQSTTSVVPDADEADRYWWSFCCRQKPEG
ncbi:Alpha/beta hydrolase family-domain-containing protein [Melanogaster broomeanus]|nr:Alpha/beta hydrolase family-domain-containing protein [Melanogaster broomeanus]